MRFARLGVLAAAALVAACETPRPFGRDVTGEPEVGLPQTSAEVLCISAFPALSPEMAAALRGALADELVRREILAAPADPCPAAAPQILAWLAAPPENGVAPLMISRPPRDGRAMPPIMVALPLDAPEAAPRWALTLADRLGYRPPRVPSTVSPLETLMGRAPARGGLPPPADAPKPQMEKVFVDLVDGAGSDGNTLLRFAMIGHLRRAGMQPVVKAEDGAPWAVKGTVDVGPARTIGTAEVRRIAIVWTVKDADGRTLGTFEQGNTVPAAALARAWGAAAEAIAAAAAPGIAATIDKARAARDAGTR
ncbi:exported hypothetical protein [uncultured Alphaproteobacteria bacterium]|uniref:Lipoprotein n=1 Tax=uncultured Alphaproteobacteria bacterium TaxID=91750 RepID=A0A212JWS6_9PROT|nr:exported hypothetical protein [uncultured Alphaproteobacteria bacterium]